VTGCLGPRVLGVRYDTAVFHGLAPQVVHGARGSFVVPGLLGHSSTSCHAADAAPEAFRLPIHPTQPWLHLPSLQVSHPMSLESEATGMANPNVCLSMQMVGFTKAWSKRLSCRAISDDNQSLLIRNHHMDTAAHGPQVMLCHEAYNAWHPHGALWPRSCFWA